MLLKSFELKGNVLSVIKEEKHNDTRFSKYFVKENENVLMTAYYYDKVSKYWDFLVSETLEKK